MATHKTKRSLSRSRMKSLGDYGTSQYEYESEEEDSQNKYA